MAAIVRKPLLGQLMLAAIVGALSQWLGAKQAMILCRGAIAPVTVVNSIWMRAPRHARH